MLRRFLPGLTLLLAMPAWSQVIPSATGGGSASGAGTPMQTPPPVSAGSYPTSVGAETRSNYLSGGLVVNIAYDDNVIGGASGTPVGDVTYSLHPTVTLDQASSRFHRTFTYSPGFTFYQRISTLNQMDQIATGQFEYRLTPHMTLSVLDAFQKSSNVFNQANPLLGGAISGSGQPSAVVVLVPFADQLINTANGELSYQFSPNGMIGVGGVAANLNYANPNQALGLYNSSTRGGSAFYNRRLSSTQYFGVTYQYSDSLASPVNAQSETQTHAIFPFYTLYLRHTLSFSVSGGPQYFEATQTSSPTSRSWTPSVVASFGWHSAHTNFAASYSRMVSGGGGLLGAYQSSTGDASVRRQLSRTWTVGAAARYAINKNVNSLLVLSSPGGHSILGSTSLQHVIGQHLNAELEYERIHQSYLGIPAISIAPDSNRASVSISYQFSRPLGR